MRAVGGRIVGTLAATVTLIVLGLVALGLFTSVGGLLIAGTIATVAGIIASVIVEPRKPGRNAVVVAGYVAILLLGSLIVGQTTARYAPSGSPGGPAVMPPR
jgi:hypothetical protein